MRCDVDWAGISNGPNILHTHIVHTNLTSTIDTIKQSAGEEVYKVAVGGLLNAWATLRWCRDCCIYGRSKVIAKSGVLSLTPRTQSMKSLPTADVIRGVLAI